MADSAAGVVDDRPGRGLDGAVEQRVGRVAHPRLQPGVELGADGGVHRVLGEVAHLPRVHHQVVELDARARPLAPARRDEQRLGGGLVDVGQHGLEPVAEVADELVTPRADRALRVVGGVVGQLGEELVADLGGLLAHEREQARAVGVRRQRRPGDRAEGRVEVHVGDERVGDVAAEEAAGPADDQQHAEPAVGQRRLRPGEGQAVVGRQHDERLVGQAGLVEGMEDGADPLVQRAGAGLEAGHVVPGLGRVGQVRRRDAVQGIAHGAGLEELAMGLEEADRGEEGLGRAAEQQLARGRGDRVDLRRADVDDVVVAQRVRVPGHVLLADERRPVARPAQWVHQVAARVGQLPPAVGQAGHPVDVGPLARQQAGAAARAARGRAEGLAEEQPLVRQPLDVRRRDLLAVGLHVAAGVVGVQVDDVGSVHGVPRIVHRNR